MKPLSRHLTIINSPWAHLLGWVFTLPYALYMKHLRRYLTILNEQ